MRASTVPVTLVVLVIMSQSLAIVSHVELERGLAHLETDYGGPITYTDEHTDATLGSSNRGATLTMPGGHDYERPLPLVVALHGYSSSGSFNAWWMSLYDSVHENEHLLLTPDGSMNIIGMRYWNATDACCNLFNTQVDDVTFLESLIVQAVQNYGADPEGVVLIGHSNGAFMSHRMACERGGIIESIVSLNGATWDDFSNNCPDTGRPNILQVHGTGDTVIQYDGGSTFGGMYPSAPQTTTFWADRSGCEMSWTNLGSIDLTNSDGVAETDNLEHLNCTDGNRVTHWRINNASHSPLLNDKKWPSETLGWALEDFVRDSDGDGHRDDVDAFVYDSGEWLDNDDDGIGDNADTDDDNDGLTDSEEAGLGTDPLNWDTDGDEVSDLTDCDPINGELYTDTDLDGVCDEVDEDADGDNWNNDQEVDCLTDWLDISSVPSDLDSDGVCDEVDEDADGDNWNNDQEVDCLTDWLDVSSVPSDLDSDGECDPLDIDDDGDWVVDIDDAFPMDPSETNDLDGDGIGDNTDQDDDGDGWLDVTEAICAAAGGQGDPRNADVMPVDNETDVGADGVYGTDDDVIVGDGLCNAIDPDDDNDGYPDPVDINNILDEEDAFQYDPTEWLDTDNDGVGDNADAFPSDPNEWSDADDDGVGDNSDAFPNEVNEWSDLDGDGVGDNTDAFPTDPLEWIDTDGDGFGDNSDAFPMDVDEWQDADGDGVGNNADAYPFDSSKWEKEPNYVMIGLAGALAMMAILGYTRQRHD
jgi:poly(3-hydroxybutyrate) depolymerase